MTRASALVLAPPRAPSVSFLAPLQAAPEPHFLYDASKRATDLGLGLLLLAVAAPVILLGAAAVFLSSGHSPFYRHERVGLLGREFAVAKLRTMVPAADVDVPQALNETGGPTFKARDDPRVTRIGRVLRRTSIDELPQLANVVLGQMSLVGPRAPLMTEALQYTSSQLERLTVKPGLTCIWQVSGRSTVGFRRWAAMDRVYVRRRSLWLDLALLARTPRAVLSMKGAW